MGHLTSFSGKEKEGHSKSFEAAGPVTVHICCVVSRVRMFVHVFVRRSLAAESSCSTLGSCTSGGLPPPRVTGVGRHTAVIRNDGGGKV